MQRTIWTAVGVALWALTAGATLAQSAFSSEAYNFRLKLPSGWAAQLSEDEGAPSLYAVTADDEAAVYMDIFIDSPASLADFIEEMENDMDLAWDDEPSKQPVNGMEALWGTGAGVAGDNEAALVVFALRNGKFVYVGYGACPLNKAPKYLPTLKSIVASISPHK
mgnify:CR=1 FL=1